MEVALGLLSEDEATALLLGTAEIAAPTELETAAGKTISKMAGYLPLYISMVGAVLRLRGLPLACFQRFSTVFQQHRAVWGQTS